MEERERLFDTLPPQNETEQHLPVVQLDTSTAGNPIDVSELDEYMEMEMERHVPVVLLANTSSSMAGKPIEELNQGLIEFGKALNNGNLANVVDICVISFNSEVRTEVGFRPATLYEAPVFKAGGLTSMNKAIITGLNVIKERKQEYRMAGIDYYYKPLLFVLTDGIATDIKNEAEAKSMLQDAISENHIEYVAVGIGAYADIAHLQSYYPADETQRPVLKATVENFVDAFCRCMLYLYT